MISETRLERVRDLTRRVRSEQSYSLARALSASGNLDWSAAPLEKEFSDSVCEALGAQYRLANSFYPCLAHRDLVTSTASAGGYLVSAANLLTVTRPRSSNDFLHLCTTVQTGGAGIQRIGRFDALPTVTTLADQTSAISEGSPTTSQSLLDASNIGTYLEFSREFVLQSEQGTVASVDALMGALKNYQQVQIIEGSGTSNEVLGLANDSTVTNASGATLAWSTVCETMQVVEEAAGDGELAWVVTGAAANVLRQRAIVGSSGPAILDNGRIAGYPVVVIGGTTSATAIFGRWRDLLIYEWAPLEIGVNPFAIFKSGIIGIRGWLSFNAAPLVAGSFATITDIS